MPTSLKKGDTVYVRYIGNIRHWNKALFTAQVASVSQKYMTVDINGEQCRFDSNSLRHDNRGHQPAYRVYLTADAYALEAELQALKDLMTLTNFTELPLDKQRAIRAIIESKSD
ncbi:beta barrel domain-containing protein [Fibrella forsythiae]|uniref:Uncharacterized protein n=1 Tax=Fibrella forsythiae TaxID=2817061 RepID=A0ABS3JCM8_9BACT|nr:hypothetical protein [Fibrella forsythiae]MBO0947191.1 hypothetical protein [Fibrella forsythiae]